MDKAIPKMSQAPDCDHGEIHMGTHITLHLMFGHMHPQRRLLEVPTRWVPCVLRWTHQGKATDYLLTSRDDLHRMILWVLDLMAVNVLAPTTVDDFDQLREHWPGWFSPADHADVIHDIDYEEFQAIRRAKHGPMAWWWFQRNFHVAQRTGWTFEFVEVSLEGIPGTLPVPTDEPPSPITWLTPP